MILSALFFISLHCFVANRHSFWWMLLTRHFDLLDRVRVNARCTLSHDGRDDGFEKRVL